MASAPAVEFEYQPESKTLVVKLCEAGELYRYIDVPPAVFEAFKKASSKTRFIEKYLKDRYCHQRG
jgi:KTSC domain